MDSHYSITLNLNFSDWPSKLITGLFCPSPISSISFLFSLLSRQVTMLIDLHICLTYFHACSLPLNTSHFSLLIHAYHFKIQLKTLSCEKPVLLKHFLFFCSMLFLSTKLRDFNFYLVMFCFLKNTRSHLLRTYNVSGSVLRHFTHIFSIILNDNLLS